MPVSLSDKSYRDDQFGARFGSEQTEDSDATVKVQDDLVLEQVSIVDDRVAKRFRSYFVF